MCEELIARFGLTPCYDDEYTNSFDDGVHCTWFDEDGLLRTTLEFNETGDARVEANIEVFADTFEAFDPVTTQVDLDLVLEYNLDRDGDFYEGAACTHHLLHQAEQWRPVLAMYLSHARAYIQDTLSEMDTDDDAL
jgi:hypothetical protein